MLAMLACTYGWSWSDQENAEKFQSLSIKRIEASTNSVAIHSSTTMQRLQFGCDWSLRPQTFQCTCTSMYVHVQADCEFDCQSAWPRANRLEGLPGVQENESSFTGSDLLNLYIPVHNFRLVITGIDVNFTILWSNSDEPEYALSPHTHIDDVYLLPETLREIKPVNNL